MIRIANIAKIIKPIHKIFIQPPIVQCMKPLNTCHMDKSLQNKLKWVIVDSKFPDCIVTDMKHKILWINPNTKINQQQIYKIISRYVRAHQHNKYIYFQNPIDAKLVPPIIYYHILINPTK